METSDQRYQLRHPVAGRPPLLWVIRDELGMTGTKYGCGMAQCGACSVLVDGVVTRSYVTPLDSGQDARITYQGHRGRGRPARRRKWVQHRVPQCGCCQSGRVMAATSLLEGKPRPQRRRHRRRHDQPVPAAAPPQCHPRRRAISRQEGGDAVNSFPHSRPICPPIWPTCPPIFPAGDPVNLSRRGSCPTSAGAAAGRWSWLWPGRPAIAGAAAAAAAVAPTRVPAFLRSAPTIPCACSSPFAEGTGRSLPWPRSSARTGRRSRQLSGQDRARRQRLSGREQHDTCHRRQHVGAAPAMTPCKLGAIARQMLLQAAARQLNLPMADRPTQTRHPYGPWPIHSLWRSGRRRAGHTGAGLPAWSCAILEIPLDRSAGRRVDVRAKSTDRRCSPIDTRVDGMLHAAVQHAAPWP